VKPGNYTAASHRFQRRQAEGFLMRKRQEFHPGAALVDLADAIDPQRLKIVSMKAASAFNLRGMKAI
jgi:hypothetical protein